MAYRFGFNGQEKDDEVVGAGNSYTAEFWQYDPRLGRRWNRDPVPDPSLSDYAVFGNNPIVNVDPNGAYFFGLFGSTSEQRRTARDFAAASGGTIKNITKKSISVDFNTVHSEFDPETNTNAAVITNHTMKFLPGGGFDFGDVSTNSQMRFAYESSLAFGDYNMYTGYPKGSGALAAPTIDPIDILAGGLAGLTRQGIARNVSKSGATIPELFANGKTPAASELVSFAETQGWKATQTAKGPLKFIDANGVERMIIKQGSSRTPGSNLPHVSFKNAEGKFINPAGDVVSRSSVGNHSPINYDLR